MLPNITSIKSIHWFNPEKSIISLLVDTDEEQDYTVVVPYSSDSPIWDLIKDYNVNNILEYEPPPPIPTIDPADMTTISPVWEGAPPSEIKP